MVLFKWKKWKLELGSFRNDVHGCLAIEWNNYGNQKYCVKQKAIHLNLNPRKWQWGQDHIYYDGPHCIYYIGPIEILDELSDCGECSNP